MRVFKNTVCLDFRKRQQEEDGKNYIVRNLTVSTFQQILLGDYEVGRTCNKHVEVRNTYKTF
jgi:hypothetical protein